MKTLTCKMLPCEADTETVYTLEPQFDPAFYAERTNRNIGWITAEEQELLHNSVVGIAGCGGMGGLVAATLLRLGIGTIKIADTECFEVSNLNRQFAATRHTLGMSKAFSTATMLRDIADDTTLIVYPQGITEETVGNFVEGCDLILDEIEFWCIGSRILLHKTMRDKKSLLLNSPTVGHRVYVTKFTSNSMTIEKVLGTEYEKAKTLQECLVTNTATKGEIKFIMEGMLRFAAPELPEYSIDTNEYSTVSRLQERLLTENKASIVATNPPMASGFLANQVLFHLLDKYSSIRRNFILPPIMPGYSMFDAGTLTAKRFEGIWWS